MTPETICLKLKDLIETMPDLVRGTRSNSKVQIWLSEVNTFVKASNDLRELAKLRHEVHMLETLRDPEIFWNARVSATANIESVLFRVHSHMKLKALEERDKKLNTPDVSQESFIGAGKGFDAFTAIVKVFGKATKEILIVDPYLDEKIFTDFMLAIPEYIPAKLLASNKNNKRGILQPAFNRWAGQHGGTRPTELRVASHNDLHDRLVIVDSIKVWILSQSFNSFAERAPASIMLSQTPEEKIEFYKNMWNNAESI